MHEAWLSVSVTSLFSVQWRNRREREKIALVQQKLYIRISSEAPSDAKNLFTRLTPNKRSSADPSGMQISIPRYCHHPKVD
jgi:hypothetical protein